MDGWWRTPINAALALIFTTIAMVALVGCAGEVPVTKDETPTPVVTANGETKAPKETKAADPNPLAYVKAVASNDVDQIKAAEKLAAKGSVAAAYLQHQANLENAELDGGMTFTEADDAHRKGDAIELCYWDAPDDCLSYAGFKVDQAGKITEFTIDGKPISGVLTVGSGNVQASKGVKVQFLTAYRNKAGLWVIAKVSTSTKPIDIGAVDATYRAPDGKQRKATESVGAYELDAKSSTIVGMLFAGAQPGGKVTLDGFMDDYMTEWKTTVKVG
jgi:hypothetical protein